MREGGQAKQGLLKCMHLRILEPTFKPAWPAADYFLVAFHLRLCTAPHPCKRLMFEEHADWWAAAGAGGASRRASLDSPGRRLHLFVEWLPPPMAPRQHHGPGSGEHRGLYGLGVLGADPRGGCHMGPACRVRFNGMCTHSPPLLLPRVHCTPAVEAHPPPHHHGSALESAEPSLDGELELLLLRANVRRRHCAPLNSSRIPLSFLRFLAELPFPSSAAPSAVPMIPPPPLLGELTSNKIEIIQCSDVQLLQHLGSGTFGEWQRFSCGVCLLQQ